MQLMYSYDQETQPEFKKGEKNILKFGKQLSAATAF